jgi:hypothetical protein
MDIVYPIAAIIRLRVKIVLREYLGDISITEAAKALGGMRESERFLTPGRLPDA